MTWCGALRRIFQEKASAFGAPGLLALGLVLFMSAFGAGDARAEITFPSQIPKTSEALAAIIKAVPGLDAAGIKNFKASATSASAEFKIKGEAVTVVVFKRSGIPKVLLAILPDDFKLGAFLPIPRGTPVDGIKFKDMALVIVPKGAAKNGVSTSGLPQAVSRALSHLGQKVDFKAGLNLFGQADFTSSSAIKKVLSAVGHTNLRLPLGGAFSADVFKHDLKTASRKLREELLAGLHFNLPLPRLRIPGMPNIVSVNDAHLVIVGREVKGKGKVFAGVTGEVDVKVNGTKKAFSFGILAGDPGKQWKATITGESKDKITLPFFKSLALTDMRWVAARKGGKWDVVVNAKAKLNNKEVDVAISRDARGGTSAEIKGKIKLADLLPSGVSIPGVTDVEFDDLQINKDFVQVTGKIKKLDTVIAVFKRGGKTYIAINNPRPIKISTLISAAKGTALDDATFQHMTYIWAPRGAAETGLAPSVFPPDIAYNVKQVVKKVDLKEGLNVVGRMAIERNSKVGSLLSKVGAYKSALPLVGKLSPKIFHPGSGAEIKNEILDALDFKLPLPKLSLPGMSKVANIRRTVLAVKGVNKGGKRGIDVTVSGELDVQAGGNSVAFDFDVEVKKQAGKPDQIKFIGRSEPGKSVSINMIEKVKLENLSIIVLRQGRGWGWQLTGQAPFRSKRLTINLENTLSNRKSLSFGTGGLSLAEIAGFPNLPVLGGIRAGWIVATKNNMRLDMTIKGIGAEVMLYKPQGASKYHAGFAMGDISPDKLIPGTSNTPLKDASFKNLVFVYNPSKKPEQSEIRDLPLIFGQKLPQNSPRITFKPGLNIFGKINVHPAGELGGLLKKVGITEVTFPLNGKFSPKAFAKNISGTAIKNAILNSLDIKADLPNLKIPGLPGTLAIRSTHLKIKGKDTAGRAELDLSVSGVMDAKLAGKEIDFDFDIDIAKAAGSAADLTIRADSTKSFTLPWIHSLKLTSLNMTATRKGKRWTTTIDAKTTIKHKKADITARWYGGEPYLTVNTKLSLADLVPGNFNVPGLNDVLIEGMQIWPKRMVIRANIKGMAMLVESFHRAGVEKAYVNLSLRKLTLETFIPWVKGTPLDDVELSDVTLLWAPKGAAASNVAISSIPTGPSFNMLQFNPRLHRINIREGFNLYGNIHPKPGTKLGNFLAKLGIRTNGVPINGGLSRQIFHPNPAAVKSVLLGALDLNVKLPPLKISEIDKFVTFKNGHLVIKGKTPAGKEGIYLDIGGEADLKIGKETLAFDLDVQDTRSGGRNDLKITGKTTKAWKHPFGIDFLTLDSLRTTIDIKGTTKNFSIFAKTDLGSHQRLDVDITAKEVNGKLTDAFFELDGPLKLSEIPGVKDIPNASHFEIDTIKISEHGIEAKTDFGDKKDLDVFLFTGSGWNLIVRQDNFAITEFVPPLKNTPLKHVVLSEAAIVLSKDGLQGQLSDFSIIAQDALKDIYGKNASDINVDSGLSLIAAFEHKNSKGGMADAFSRLGLKDERLILTGGIGGLFGGPTQLDVQVVLSGHSGAKNQPKWMKSKPGVEAVFSMIATESGGQFDIEFGIGVDIIANVHGTELVFDAKTALEFEDEKIDVKIVADLKDKKGWKKPFGIPGFTLYEVGFDLGIAEDGAIHLGFDGNITVSGDNFTIAADADLLPEALGAPQDIAFIGSADKVDMFFVEEIAIAMLGGDFKLDIPGGILPTFTDVKFAFVTPGAQDPDLHITGEGFALAGGMSWLDHELGSMDVSVGPTSGITAGGKIDDLNLGPLHLKNNDFSMKIGLKSVPSLKLDSDIEFIGIKERFKLAFDKTGISIDAKVRFGPDFSMTSDLKLSGIDLSVKKPSFRKADFYMKGDFQLDIGKFIAGPARKSLDDVFNGLNKAFKKAEIAIKAAEKTVDGLTGKINAARAKVRREKARAESRVQGAENRVNSLNGTLSYKWGRYHHCHGWGKWPCRARWGISIGWTKTEIAVADAALNFVKSLISHFPIDFDPTVAALIVERDTAKGVLYVAEKAVEGADDLDLFMKKAVDKLTNDLKNSINIHKAGFSGDLRGIIEHDTPVDLTIDAEFFGATINDTFAFKIKDIAYDVEQLGLMGLYALEHLVEKGINDLPGPLKNKLKGAISTLMDAKAASRNRELAKYKKQFGDYNKTAKAIQVRIAAYNTAYLKSKLAKTGSPLDYDKTETFSDDMIEVGHTGLCLSNIGARVVQESCTGTGIQRWTTQSISGAPHTNSKGGYVQIKQPSGGCITLEGHWTTKEASFEGGKGESFTFEVPTFVGNDFLIVLKCKNSKEFYWKVLKHGDGWMQMASPAINQCVHFENSSAVPKWAEAQWKPCTGAANQVFRIADSTTPKYYKTKLALRNDAQSACFADPNAKGEILMVSCTKAARYDYSIDIRGYIKFISTSTGNCLQPESYADGAKLIERKCSNLDYQWWNPAETPGGWRLQNGQTGKCTRTKGLGKVAEMGDCRNFSQNIVAPVTDPNSGIVLKWKSGSAFPAHFNAAYSGTANVGICAMGSMVGSTWLTGTLMPNGACWVSFVGQDVLGGKEFYDKGPRQQYIAITDGIEWVESGGGKITEYAIPTGFTDFPGKGTKTSYTCRTKFAGKFTGGGQTSRVGWTVDGRTCQYAYYGFPGATTFEVLARHPDKAYRLHLGDLKPVPKPGAHRPGPLALSEKMLSDLPKNLVPEPVVKQVKVVVKKVKKTVRRVRRFFHHRW